MGYSIFKELLCEKKLMHFVFSKMQSVFQSCSHLLTYSLAQVKCLMYHKGFSDVLLIGVIFLVIWKCVNFYVFSQLGSGCATISLLGFCCFPVLFKI